MTRDNMKKSYLHLYKTYEHQTWQGADLGWETHTCHILCPFDHVATSSHVQNLERYIFISARPLNTKLDRVVT